MKHTHTHRLVTVPMAFTRCHFCATVMVSLCSIFAAADDHQSCNTILSNAVDSLSTRITSSCEAGSITWEKPHGSQTITFLKNTSFTLCISSNFASSSATIYRLVGPSRRLLVPKSHDGALGCYASQCNHVSLLIEPHNSSGHIELMYRTNLDTRCPMCTESCHVMCLCTAPYVFTGEITSSVLEHEQFTHYLRIIRTVKNDGIYIPGALNLPTDQCIPHSKHSASHYLVDIEGQLPSEGLVGVHSTCALNLGSVYLVSARLHSGPRPGLMLCCAEDDEDYAISYLEDLLEAETCCS